MKPIEFEGCNVIYAKDQPEYQPLPANKSPNGNTITCWQLSEKEIAEIVRTGKLYMSIHTFNKPLSPIFLSVYELEHNHHTGNTCYKNMPECDHEFNDHHYCVHCHQKQTPCERCEDFVLIRVKCQKCEQEVCESCLVPHTATNNIDYNCCNYCYEQMISNHN